MAVHRVDSPMGAPPSSPSLPREYSLPGHPGGGGAGIRIRIRGGLGEGTGFPSQVPPRAVQRGPLKDRNARNAMDATAECPTERDAVATHLGLRNVQEFVDDAVNAVNDYVADGFDALERYLRKELPTDPATSSAISRGVEAVYLKLNDGAAKNLAKFEEYAKAHVFFIPPALKLDTEAIAQVTGTIYTEDAEIELDRELEELRASIVAAREATHAMEKEITSTGKEMEALAGAISELKEVCTVGKENTFMSENAAAVASVALKLKPVVEKAATLRDAGNYTTPVKSRLGMDQTELEYHQYEKSAGYPTIDDLRKAVTYLQTPKRKSRP